MRMGVKKVKDKQTLMLLGMERPIKLIQPLSLLRVASNNLALFEFFSLHYIGKRPLSAPVTKLSLMLIVRHAAKLLHIPRNLWGEGHLIISIRVRRLESESHRNQLRSYSTTTTYYNMASSINNIVQKLKGFSIEPTATIAHAETSSTATWKEALIASGSAPKSFEIIKTLVYKPKTAKTATPVPVVVIARDETDTSSTAIGKKLNLKELRLASEDLLRDFFSLDKNTCTLHSAFF